MTASSWQLFKENMGYRLRGEDTRHLSAADYAARRADIIFPHAHLIIDDVYTMSDTILGPAGHLEVHTPASLWLTKCRARRMDVEYGGADEPRFVAENCHFTFMDIGTAKNVRISDDASLQDLTLNTHLSAMSRLAITNCPQLTRVHCGKHREFFDVTQVRLPDRQECVVSRGPVYLTNGFGGDRVGLLGHFARQLDIDGSQAAQARDAALMVLEVQKARSMQQFERREEEILAAHAATQADRGRRAASFAAIEKRFTPPPSPTGP